MIDLARLPLVNPKRVGPAAMMILNVLQNCTPEVQAAASAIVFALVCERNATRPGDVMAVATNILNSDGNSPWLPEIRAARMYVQNEIR